MSPREVKEGRLPSFSLNRRITVLVLFMTLTVIGMVATSGIPAELFPSGFSAPSMFVSTPWQDAPAREVLDKITIPLEEEFGTIKGVKRVTSVSMTGMSRVFISFKTSADMDVAYREVRDRVERARTLFPSDVDRVYLNKQDLSEIPVYMLGVAIDPDLQNAYDLIKNQVMVQLERVEGVAKINAFGLEEKEILIDVDRERTDAAGLNIYELAQELSDDNFTLASGTVYSGSRKLLLRSVAEYADVEALRNRVIRDSIRLRDIATVRYAEPDQFYRARVDSKPAVALQILKEGDANTREVTRNLDAAFEKLAENPRLAGLDMANFFDQGDVIDESLFTMRDSGLIGGVIAACVLLFFMRRLRLTLIVALAIPFSLVIGISVMFFAGETLNVFTLVGLMVCVGLLVDNSVVVAENIHRWHREGHSRRDSCVKGAGEVALAIVMSTLTTIVVFAPSALVDGPAQFFLLRLAIPIAVSVAASLFVALIFIPLCVYLTLPTKPETETETLVQRNQNRLRNVLRIAYDWTFAPLNGGYNKVLAFFLQRRFDLVVVMLIVFGVTMSFFGQKVKFVGQQEEEQSVFNIEVDMPESTTYEEAVEWVNEAEAVVAQYVDEWGMDGYFTFHDKTSAQIQGWFNPDREATITIKQALEVLTKEIPVRPGMELFTGNDREADEEGLQVYTAFVRGEDPDALDDVAEDLERLFLQVDGVVGMRKSGSSQPPELGLVIDREKAQHFNVNPQVIAGVVGYALRGQELPKYQAEGREIPVRVRFEEADRESLAELQSFYVPTEGDDFLPVSALTTTKRLDSSQVIVRRDKMIGRTVTVELEDGREEETREALMALQAGMDLPEGMDFGADRKAQAQDEDLATLQFAFLLSIIFIYLLMGFLFESFVLPLSIILTIPLSFIGVAWGHLFAQKDIDFLGAVGVILLVGVVVNNGIVLIDYVNRLREEGVPRNDALLRAASLRFRPIMMTAITTIGGLVPLALAGANSIGISYTSFSLTLIGGMLTATLLTLLVVPVFYAFFDDAREAMGAALKRGLTRYEPPVEADDSVDPVLPVEGGEPAAG